MDDLKLMLWKCKKNVVHNTKGGDASYLNIGLIDVRLLVNV